jgi:uncharacterized protein
MVIVSDTSALTSLIQIGRERVLLDLFSRVLIPQAVRQELSCFHDKLPEFLETIEISNSRAVDELSDIIDRGEAEAVILAMEHSPDFLVIDDAAARNVAIAKGLPVIGLLGVLLKAKKAGVLDAVKPVISDLESIAGFRISPDLKILVLQAAQEP